MQPRAVLDPLVGVVMACVCAGDRVFRGVGGKYARVLAGNVLQGVAFVEVMEFHKRLEVGFHETSCRPKEYGREHKNDPLRSFGGVIFLCLNAVPARVIARIVYERGPSRGRVSVLIWWRGFCSPS